MSTLALPVSTFFQKASRKLHDSQTRLHSATRKALARAVYAVPPLRRYDPRRKVVTFQNHCRAVAHFPPDLASAPADWYFTVRSPETLRRRPSRALNATQAAEFRAACQHYQGGDTFHIPEIFIAALSRAKVLAPSLVTLSRDHHIFLESALCKPEVLEQHGILDTLFRPRRARLAGAHCLLGTPWSYGYYHWLLEALPRLDLIERFPALAAANLIVAAPLARFQRESLALAGVSPGRIVSLPSSFTEVERLYFPQISAPSGNPSPHAVAWLRARFLPKAATTNPATRQLYITRRDAPQRQLLNEEDIVRVLVRNGFEIVALGDMAFSEQIRLFSEARMVVAPHGAGVTNIVFCPPGTTVVEFFGRNYINGCYWALANICDHRHAFLTGPTARLDYRISPTELEELLQSLARE